MRELYDKDTIQKYLQDDIYYRMEEIIYIDDLIGQSTNIKLGDEEFNYKTLRDKKGILTNFIDENLILGYFRIIADSFDRTDFKMNIDLIKEKYAM